MTTGAQLQPAGIACATCPARSGKCILPEASAHARLAVVGETPARSDLEVGRPFGGAGGRLLARGLQTIGLRRHDVHWTNAVLCECADEDLPAARRQCADRLRAELAAAGAPVVMPVGAFGLQSALGLSKRPQIMKWRGSISEAAYGAAQALVTPTVHPAFIMRAPQWGPVLEIDVARIGRLIALCEAGGKWLPPECDPSRRIVIARNEGVLRSTLASLGRYVGNDVETVGLGPTETMLVCLALSDGPTTVVIPWSRGRDGRDPWWGMREPRIAEAISECLATRVSVTHNGPAFDHIVEARYGIEIAEWDDSLLATHSVASHMPKNLAHVVTQGLDVPPWKQLEDRTADLERLWHYNARDTLYTRLRWEQIQQELRA